MKRNQFLVSSLLTVSLALPFVQQAWGADRAKVVTAKKRVPKKKAIPAPLPVGAAATTVVSSGAGMRLLLSTTLREPAPVAPIAPPVAVAPAPVVTAVPAYSPRQIPFISKQADNPYLARPPAQVAPTSQEAPAVARPGSGGLFSNFALSIPLLPESGQSILPKITKVYPTGEKPLVVVSFKCPTEVVGITPPTIKILHEAVSLGMAGLNKTDLLSFDLQQVCQ